MANKVVLVLVDGLKGESVLGCNNEFAKKLVENYTSKLNAQAVMPSVTLPCHLSLFLSVVPQRHGILTNTYVPQVRPIDSIIDCVAQQGKKAAMFYNWEQLRNLAKEGSLQHSLLTGIECDQKDELPLTNAAIDYINDKNPDFVFLYFGSTDVIAHNNGWESDEYIKGINTAFDYIEKLMASIPKDYTIVITSDHGGHDRIHGTDLPSDMTIPIIIAGEGFTPDVKLPDSANIIDIAPTIAQIIGIEPNNDWDGKSLLGDYETI